MRLVAFFTASCGGFGNVASTTTKLLWERLRCGLWASCGCDASWDPSIRFSGRCSPTVVRLLRFFCLACGRIETHLELESKFCTCSILLSALQLAFNLAAT